MKRVTMLLVLLAMPVVAQDADTAPIKVTTTLHPDGTRTVMTVYPQTQTAEEMKYDGGEKLLRRTLYALNDQGQPEQSIVYNPQGAVLYKATFKLDYMNRVTEELNYTPDDQLLRRLVYHYGTGGRVTKVEAFDAEGRAVDGDGKPQPTPTQRRTTRRRR